MLQLRHLSLSIHSIAKKSIASVTCQSWLAFLFSSSKYQFDSYPQFFHFKFVILLINLTSVTVKKYFDNISSIFNTTRIVALAVISLLDIKIATFELNIHRNENIFVSSNVSTISDVFRAHFWHFQTIF